MAGWRVVRLEGVMLQEFILRGNVLDLAVAVVMGGFGALVTSLVNDLLTPLIAAVVGGPDFSALTFAVNGSKVLIGDFISAVVSFPLIAGAIYFFVVTPMNAVTRGFAAARRWLTRRRRPVRSVSARYQLLPVAAPPALSRSVEAGVFGGRVKRSGSDHRCTRRYFKRLMYTASRRRRLDDQPLTQ